MSFVSSTRVGQSHHSLTQFHTKAKGICLLNTFLLKNSIWRCFRRLFYLLEGQLLTSEQSVPAGLALVHNPPSVCELHTREGGTIPLKRTPLASLLWVHPKTHPNHASSHTKGELLDQRVPPYLPIWNTVLDECSQADKLHTPKALIQLGEISIDFTTFNLGALKRWMGVCLKTPKQRCDFWTTRNQERNCLLDKQKQRDG